MHVPIRVVRLKHQARRRLQSNPQQAAAVSATLAKTSDSKVVMTMTISIAGRRGRQYRKISAASRAARQYVQDIEMDFI